MWLLKGNQNPKSFTTVKPFPFVSNITLNLPILVTTQYALLGPKKHISPWHTLYYIFQTG